MRRVSNRWILAAAGALLLSVSPVRATAIITVTEVGSDVITTGSGSLDLSALAGPITAGESPSIKPNEYLEVGATGSRNTNLYFGASGPASFGSGTTDFHPTSGSGDGFGVQSTSIIEVPVGYVFGQALSGTDTYVGQSLASLGVTPGTYVWKWGSGAQADSLTVEIGASAAAAPLPSSLAGGSALLAMVGLLAFRRRAQA